MNALAFVLVCGATAWVCTAVKEDEPAAVAVSSGRLFLVLALGIAAFGVVIQVFTALAG